MGIDVTWPRGLGRFAALAAALAMIVGSATLAAAQPLGGTAQSCATVQKGKLIYEDTFDDDSGGWPTDPDTKYGKVRHLQQALADFFGHRCEECWICFQLFEHFSSGCEFRQELCGG